MWTLSGVQSAGSLLPDRGSLCLDFGIYSHCESQQSKNTRTQNIFPFPPFPLNCCLQPGHKNRYQNLRVHIYYFSEGHTGDSGKVPPEGTSSPKGAEPSCLSRYYRASHALFSKEGVSLISENVFQPEGCETLSRISRSQHLEGSLGDCPDPFHRSVHFW